MSVKLSPYYTTSLVEALRHPLYNADRQEFLDRQEEREHKKAAKVCRRKVFI